MHVHHALLAKTLQWVLHHCRYQFKLSSHYYWSSRSSCKAFLQWHPITFWDYTWSNSAI